MISSFLLLLRTTDCDWDLFPQVQEPLYAGAISSSPQCMFLSAAMMECQHIVSRGIKPKRMRRKQAWFSFPILQDIEKRKFYSLHDFIKWDLSSVAYK